MSIESSKKRVLKKVEKHDIQPISHDIALRGLTDLATIEIDPLVRQFIEKLKYKNSFDERVNAWQSLRKMGPTHNGWSRALIELIDSSEEFLEAVFSAEALSHFKEKEEIVIPILGEFFSLLTNEYKLISLNEIPSLVNSFWLRMKKKPFNSRGNKRLYKNFKDNILPFSKRGFWLSVTLNGLYQFEMNSQLYKKSKQAVHNLTRFLNDYTLERTGFIPESVCSEIRVSIAKVLAKWGHHSKRAIVALAELCTNKNDPNISLYLAALKNIDPIVQSKQDAVISLLKDDRDEMRDYGIFLINHRIQEPNDTGALYPNVIGKKVIKELIIMMNDPVPIFGIQARKLLIALNTFDEWHDFLAANGFIEDNRIDEIAEFLSSPDKKIRDSARESLRWLLREDKCIDKEKVISIMKSLFSELMKEKDFYFIWLITCVLQEYLSERIRWEYDLLRAANEKIIICSRGNIFVNSKKLDKLVTVLSDLQQRGIIIHIIFPKFQNSLNPSKSYSKEKIAKLSQEYHESIRSLKQAGLDVQIRSNYQSTIKDEIIFIDNKTMYFCNQFTGRKVFYHSNDRDLIEMFMAKDDYLRENLWQLQK